MLGSEIVITVNGEQIENAEGIILGDYIKAKGYVLARIAIECNGEIVPKSQYDTKILSDGDIFEIINFVGGG